MSTKIFDCDLIRILWTIQLYKDEKGGNQMPQNINSNISKTFAAQSHYTTLQLRKQFADHIYNPHNLTVFDDTILIMDTGSVIELNGELELCGGCMDNYHRSLILRMDRYSRLIVTGKKFSFFYGGDIVLFSNAVLTLGNSFINSECKIRCGKSISIGDDCAISHGVTIMDSDFHILIDADGEKPRYGDGVVIEDHVWIGTDVKILKNVHIGEGAIIAAGSTVTDNIPPHSLAAGSQAKVIKTNVDWKK